MPVDACHLSILISMKIYLEYLCLIYILVNNQNIYLCGQKSVELIKNSRYMCYCTFWRYIYRKYNTGHNLCYLVNIQNAITLINKS